MKKTYAHHKPAPVAAFSMSILREAFSHLHEMIEDAAPASRERSVALSKLEESSMWAMKAVVHNDPNSTVE